MRFPYHARFSILFKFFELKPPLQNAEAAGTRKAEVFHESIKKPYKIHIKTSVPKSLSQ